VKVVAAFLAEKIRDGVSFSEALKMASPNFGELYCNLVAAGEVSGALAPCCAANRSISSPCRTCAAASSWR